MILANSDQSNWITNIKHQTFENWQKTTGFQRFELSVGHLEAKFDTPMDAILSERRYGDIVEHGKMDEIFMQGPLPSSRSNIEKIS